MTLDIIEKLGRALEQRWRAAHYDSEALPALATSLLEEAAPSEAMAGPDVLSWLFRASHIPYQDDIGSKFAQPPITLFRTSRLAVEVLFWLDGTTAIHQHAFAGAFQAIAGSSIHATYRFDVQRSFGEELLLGDLHRTGLELLRTGDTRPIIPGTSFIHSLFHLERPSMTLVARSVQTAGFQPQYTYLAPHVARHPFIQDVLLQRQLEVMPALDAMRGREVLLSEVAGLIARSDAGSALKILQKLLDIVGFEDWRVAMRPALDSARAAHGDVVDRFEPVLEEAIRKEVIIAHRARVKDPDHRFYLALLMNLSDRESIFQLLRERYPGRDPVDLVVGFADALDADAPQEELDDSTVILQHLLRGCSGDALLARLRESGFDGADLEANRAVIEAECGYYRSSPLFAPLVS